VPRRTSLWLLATAGVVVGHLLGYAIAHPTGSDRAAALAGHEYLGDVGTVVLPLGLLAVMAIAVRTVRRLGDAPTVVQLASLQIALFGVQEVLERIPGPGAPVDVLTERGVWFGVLAQVVVAWVALRLVHHTARVVRRLAAGARPRPAAAPARPARVPGRQLVPGLPMVALLPARRGPPRRAVPLPLTGP
jgi:hypothetical protein